MACQPCCLAVHSSLFDVNFMPLENIKRVLLEQIKNLLVLNPYDFTW